MYILFYNPHSGSGVFATQLDDVLDKFQSENRVIIPHRLGDRVLTDRFIEGIEWSNIEKVIVAGGDGTINQILNVLLNKEIYKPLAIFPVGTANDFSKMMQIPEDLDEMIDIALGDKYINCDIGSVNGEYFINVASFGNLVEVGQKVNPQYKTTLGVLAYYIKGIEELPKLKPVTIKMQTESQTYEDEVFFALIMNGKSAGGFRKLAPYSDVQDGLFDVLVFKKCPIYEIMPLLIKVWNGEHPKSPYIDYFKASQLEVSANVDLSSDLDGENGPSFPLKIMNLTQKIQVNVKNTNL